MRQLAPSILNNCPSLRFVTFKSNILPEFPPDNSANETDGQTVAKWLFTPSPDGVPKSLIIYTENSSAEEWSSMIEQFKAAFSNASSPACFSISFEFVPSSSLDFVVPFLVTNELTGEQLALSKRSEKCFVLFRCPIASDERDRKWDELLLMDDQWNQIYIGIAKDGIANGLLDASPGLGDQQQND